MLLFTSCPVKLQRNARPLCPRYVNAKVQQPQLRQGPSGIVGDWTCQPILAGLGELPIVQAGQEVWKGRDDLQKQTKSRKIEGLNYTSYRRDIPWTATEANPSQNCLDPWLGHFLRQRSWSFDLEKLGTKVSRAGGSYQVGDLRICFEKATLQSATVIAAVKMSSGARTKSPKMSGFTNGPGSASLIVSPDHLRADTKMRNQDQGFRLRKDGQGDFMLFQPSP